MRVEKGSEMEVEKVQPVRPERYDESYFLGACEGYTEFIASEGTLLSRRLSQAFDVAEVRPGLIRKERNSGTPAPASRSSADTSSRFRSSRGVQTMKSISSGRV